MSIKFSKNGKRLGRPPKATQSGKVFIIDTSMIVETETGTQQIRAPEFGEIECSFMKIPQYSFLGKDSEMRDGRYSTSPPDIKGLGTKQWVVLAYLKAPFEEHRKLKKNDKEIIEACLNYLNNPEERKKYQKKDPTPKYGYLKLINDDIKFIEKNGESVAVVQLATDQRTNENFWGEGEKM